MINKIQVDTFRGHHLSSVIMNHPDYKDREALMKSKGRGKGQRRKD